MSGDQQSYEEFLKRRTINLSEYTDQEDINRFKIFEDDKELAQIARDSEHLPYSTNELKRMNMEVDSNSLHSIFNT